MLKKLPKQGDWDCEIIKSNRKTIAIEVSSKGEIKVRVPRWVSDKKALEFVEEKRDWIEEKVTKAQSLQETKENIKLLSQQEHRQLARQASIYFDQKVLEYAIQLNVHFGRISIRCQKTRWGSCSAKGNLNFNYLLMLMPEQIRDYVVVHELCHLQEMNHSKEFWNLVESVMPDYKARRQYLKEHGREVMARAGY